MLEEAYGKSALTKTHVYVWQIFHDGRANVNDDPLCDRESTSTNDENIERVCEMTDESVFRRNQRKY
jgi:hypothetical protein